MLDMWDDPDTDNELDELYSVEEELLEELTLKEQELDTVLRQRPGLSDFSDFDGSDDWDLLD